MKKAICVPILLAGLTVLTVLAPVHAQNGEGSTPGTSSSQWLDYKADPQRTSSVHVSLGATPPNLVWRHSSELPARSGDAAPLVIGPPGQRRIYFAADKVVVCLDGQTGDEVKRSKPFNASIASPLALMPSEAGDLILAVTNRGELSALRASDLGSVWQTLADKQKTVSVLNSAPFIVKTSGGDRIILALGTGRLVAFDLKGQLDPNWSVVLGSFSSAPTATASVSRDGSLLYVPTQDKRVWVVNVANARVEYSISMRNAVFASPIVTDEHLIVASGSSLNGLQLNTGREDWIFDVKSDLSAPAAFKNADGTTTIFVGARNGRFYALNGANGRVLWSTDLADSITGAATATNDMVLVGTRNGVLFGLSPSDGKVIWRYRLHTERAIPQQRGRGRFGNGGFGNGGFPAAGGFPGAGAAVPGGGGFGGFGGVGGDATADPDASPDGEDEPEDGEAGGGFGGNGGPEQPDGGFPGGYPGTTGADLMATADTRNEKNPPVWDTTPTTTYGVSTTPVVLSDQVYILADNTALYSFDTRPFDADPPQLINPQLSILNTESKPALQRLDGDKGWLGPGRGPVEFVAELNDVGSGVDPTSIRVTLNGQELPPEAVASYSDINGKLLVKLTDPQIPERVNLEDGNQTLVLTARDYRGNELVRTVTFMVDNTAPVPRPAPVRQNWRGRGF